MGLLDAAATQLDAGSHLDFAGPLFSGLLTMSLILFATKERDSFWKRSVLINALWITAIPIAWYVYSRSLAGTHFFIQWNLIINTAMTVAPWAGIAVWFRHSLHSDTSRLRDEVKRLRDDASPTLDAVTSRLDQLDQLTKRQDIVKVMENLHGVELKFTHLERDAREVTAALGGLESRSARTADAMTKHDQEYQAKFTESSSLAHRMMTIIEEGDKRTKAIERQVTEMRAGLDGLYAGVEAANKSLNVAHEGLRHEVSGVVARVEQVRRDMSAELTGLRQVTATNLSQVATPLMADVSKLRQLLTSNAWSRDQIKRATWPASRLGVDWNVVKVDTSAASRSSVV